MFYKHLQCLQCFTNLHCLQCLKNLSCFTDDKDLSDWLSVTFDEDTMDCYNKRLAVGAIIAEEMRAAVYSDTGFRCSAGIAHNKVTL